MGRKKKHIIFYDEKIWKQLKEIKKSEGITYDEFFRKYLKLPDTDVLIRLNFDEVEDMLIKKYRNEDLKELMELVWILLIKSANGEYDIRKLKCDMENNIRSQIYIKK